MSSSTMKRNPRIHIVDILSYLKREEASSKLTASGLQKLCTEYVLITIPYRWQKPTTHYMCKWVPFLLGIRNS